MEVQINWVAVILAAIAGMAVGFAWYSKHLFGHMWGKLAKLDDKQQRKGARSAVLQAIAATFLTAYVLANITYLSNSFYGSTYIESALSIAFWLWIGVSASTIVIHNAHEQRRKKLTLLTIAHQFMAFLAMGFIIGWLKP